MKNDNILGLLGFAALIVLSVIFFSDYQSVTQAITSSPLTKVNLTTEPTGATVNIYPFQNNQAGTYSVATGITPFTGDIFNNRQYKITFEKNGYQTKSEIIYVPQFDVLNLAPYKLTSLYVPTPNIKLDSQLPPTLQINQGEEKFIGMKVTNTGAPATIELLASQNQLATLEVSFYREGEFPLNGVYRIITELGENESTEFTMKIRVPVTHDAPGTRTVNLIVAKENNVPVNKTLGSFNVNIEKSGLPTNFPALFLIAALIILVSTYFLVVKK